MSVYTSHNRTVPDVLPEGPLNGNYAQNEQLYTYLSEKFPYLLFIPKRYAWRDEMFKTFTIPRHKLPIASHQDEGFWLHPDIANNWLELEVCLRALGREMFNLAPRRWLARHITPFFFPARFEFLKKCRTEAAVCFAAWRARQNFLPLLGYVSMGLWCMYCWENERGADCPDWRQLVTEKTELHPTFLDYVERSIIGSWREERVGALYCIQPLEEYDPESFAPPTGLRQDIEWLLATIAESRFPIPLYLSWGKLPREMHPDYFPRSFRHLVPRMDELQYLASSHGQLRYSGWTFSSDNGIWDWRRDSPRPAPMQVSPSPSVNESAVPTAPFPPLPPYSKQRPNETIQAFFRRHRDANTQRIMKESDVDQQRRTQRAKHAEKGLVPSGACVFYWEEQDGHYIRYPGGRGNYAELWEEYPGPERRFDPISNEWDLCRLFQDNDPVFGEGYEEVFSDDDDDEDYGAHPTFPQDIDVASRLPREGNDMEVVQMQHPCDLEMAPIEDLLVYDLGPDLTESEVPWCDLREASKKCVNTVYLKFGINPRTEEPEYESCAQNLADALHRRFGFMMPPSPERFVVRDPPERSLDPKFLGAVVGMKDIGAELASQQGLANLVCTFFGQCLQARFVDDIDRDLLDYHQAHRISRPTSPFQIGRQYLKSMRNPSQQGYYYVLRPFGGGIGSEALLLPRATDLLEILRQQWGPDIKDIVKHLLARGIPFWLAYVSAHIMPASEPTSSSHRPKGFKTDTTSGLGFRPHRYVFDKHDYNVYTTRRDLRLLHTPRGRIALQYGGIVARLARSEVSDDDFFCGFNDDIYDVGDCMWDEKSQYAYWYDKLSDTEIDLLCGVYHVGTGQKQIAGKGKGKQAQGQSEPTKNDTDQTGIVSWWPKPSAWARGNLDGAWWTPQCEIEFFQKRLGHFKNGVYLLKHQNEWRHNLKFRAEVKKCWDGFETVADSVVQKILESLRGGR
ncbi:hypothetical protein B0H10DRAFT_1960077 [Mycena sp. CBHHK59/15]|nr:hypothetical protein B0H10DRAFT_1960077 [Mycena sp. CBHHK59/15]